MKKYLVLLSVLLLLAFASFARQVRDHRRNSQQPFKPSQGQPPPVANNKPTGAPITAIDKQKWYYIKRAGTEKYLMIAGHQNPSRSNAVLAVEEMQQDNTAQQWRFVATEVDGSTIYQLQNRKYTGILYAAPRELILEQPRNTESENQKKATYFMMVLNPDKSWFIITRPTGENRMLVLSSEIKRARHCMPAESAPLIGGRVLKDYECGEDSRREYVTQPPFTGQSSQKWILMEAN